MQNYQIFIKPHIKVFSSDYEHNFEIYKNFCLKGKCESPIYESYLSDVNIKSTEKFIIFLQSNSEDTGFSFRFVVDGAIEDIKKKEEIQKYLIQIME